MSRQEYGIKVQHERDIDTTSHDIRGWLEELLADKVQRFIGFQGEMTGSFSFGDVITGCLIIEDDSELDAEIIFKHVNVPGERWKVVEVKKRPVKGAEN